MNGPNGIMRSLQALGQRILVRALVDTRLGYWRHCGGQ